MNVLIACEFSGIVRDAFVERGHDAVSCDLIESDRPGNHVIGDISTVLDDGWDMMIAHPPCTFLCVTGNKWMKPEYRNRFPTRVQDREDAIGFFMALVNAPIPKIAIENPVGIMSSHYRKPDQYVQPYQFGHPHSKKTGLWLKNLSKLVPTKIVAEEPRVVPKSGHSMSRLHVMIGKLPTCERAALRSRTFRGIADAMADQWGG